MVSCVISKFWSTRWFDDFKPTTTPETTTFGFPHFQRRAVQVLGGKFSASSVFRYRLPPLPKSTKDFSQHKTSLRTAKIVSCPCFFPEKWSTSEIALVGGSKKKTRGWTTLEIARLNIQLQGTQNIPPRRALWYLGPRGYVRTLPGTQEGMIWVCPKNRGKMDGL